MPDNPPPQAFVHMATQQNTKSHSTYIDNDLTNNNPNAIVFVTRNWNPYSVGNPNHNPHPIGIWYDNKEGKWSIFNDDGKSMPDNVAFNVWVYQENPPKEYNRTSNTKNTPVSTVPDVPKVEASGSRHFKVLFYVVLPFFILWTLGGIILYFQENADMKHIQNMFMLRNNLFLSIALLLLGIILILMFVDDLWRKIFAWLGRSDPLNHPLQATIILSTTFFATLFAMAMLFPMTGYSFKSDWSLLLVATIPLLALLVLILINRYQSLSLEGAGFKFEFSGTVTPPEADPTQALHIILEEESINPPLGEIRKASTAMREARILIIQVDAKKGLELSTLQEHIGVIRTMMPIRYIIFTDDAGRYLGFIPLENFMIPATSGSQKVTRQTLNLLGVHTLALTKPAGQSIGKQALLESYRDMIQHNLTGIPVIDEKSEFKSMLERDRIEQAVVMQLLEKSVKIS